MEVRLGKRQKVRQIFKQCQLDLEPTFENVFRLSVAQKVLTHYLTQIKQAYPPLLHYSNDPEKFLTDFMLANPEKRFDTALKYVSLRILLEKIGASALRQMLGRHRQQVWYSLQQEMKKLAVPDSRDVFRLLFEQVEQYQPLRLVDFMK
ncbi:hypothetical protein BH10PAT2_BH10PAT2_0620 [soil metagenome]